MECRTNDWLPIVNAAIAFTITSCSIAFHTTITMQQLVLFTVECIVTVHSIGKLDVVAQITSITGARVTGRAARALAEIRISFAAIGPSTTLIADDVEVVIPFKC
jgi:hypothetical protein